MKTSSTKPSTRTTSTLKRTVPKKTSNKLASTISSRKYRSGLFSSFSFSGRSLTRTLLVFAVFGALLGSAFLIRSRAASEFTLTVNNPPVGKVVQECNDTPCHHYFNYLTHGDSNLKQLDYDAEITAPTFTGLNDRAWTNDLSVAPASALRDCDSWADPIVCRVRADFIQGTNCWDTVTTLVSGGSKASDYVDSNRAVNEECLKCMGMTREESFRRSDPVIPMDYYCWYDITAKRVYSRKVLDTEDYGFRMNITNKSNVKWQVSVGNNLAIHLGVNAAGSENWHGWDSLGFIRGMQSTTIGPGYAPPAPALTGFDGRQHPNDTLFGANESSYMGFAIIRDATKPAQKYRIPLAMALSGNKEGAVCRNLPDGGFGECFDMTEQTRWFGNQQYVTFETRNNPQGAKYLGSSTFGALPGSAVNNQTTPTPTATPAGTNGTPSTPTATPTPAATTQALNVELPTEVGTDSNISSLAYEAVAKAVNKSGGLDGHKISISLDSGTLSISFQEKDKEQIKGNRFSEGGYTVIVTNTAGQTVATKKITVKKGKVPFCATWDKCGS